MAAGKRCCCEHEHDPGLGRRAKAGKMRRPTGSLRSSTEKCEPQTSATSIYSDPLTYRTPDHFPLCLRVHVFPFQPLLRVSLPFESFCASDDGLSSSSSRRTSFRRSYQPPVALSSETVVSPLHPSSLTFSSNHMLETGYPVFRMNERRLIWVHARFDTPRDGTLRADLTQRPCTKLYMKLVRNGGGLPRATRDEKEAFSLAQENLWESLNVVGRHGAHRARAHTWHEFAKLRPPKWEICY